MLNSNLNESRPDLHGLVVFQQALRYKYLHNWKCNKKTCVSEPAREDLRPCLHRMRAWLAVLKRVRQDRNGNNVVSEIKNINVDQLPDPNGNHRLTSRIQNRPMPSAPRPRLNSWRIARNAIRHGARIRGRCLSMKAKDIPWSVIGVWGWGCPRGRRRPPSWWRTSSHVSKHLVKVTHCALGMALICEREMHLC